MNASTTYYRELLAARSPQKMAMLVRAIACRVVVGTQHVYTPAEALASLTRYETDACALEKCERLYDARQILRDGGYLGGNTVAVEGRIGAVGQ